MGIEEGSFLILSQVTAITSVIKPSEIKQEEIVTLVKLINVAYRRGEEGIILPNTERTSEKAITEMIQRDQLIGLRIDSSWKGCVHVGLSPYGHTNKSALLGMLTVRDESRYRAKGYGTMLMQSAKTLAKNRGYRIYDVRTFKTFKLGAIS